MFTTLNDPLLLLSGSRPRCTDLKSHAACESLQAAQDPSKLEAEPNLCIKASHLKYHRLNLLNRIIPYK